MPQNLCIPVPYYQFVPDAVNYEFSAFNYRPVPNKKIHRHCPFIIIDADYINQPMMDVAVAAAEEESLSASTEVTDASKSPDVSSPDNKASDTTKSTEQPNRQDNTDKLPKPVDSEPVDPETVAKEQAREKDRLDYLARLPADLRNKTDTSTEEIKTEKSTPPVHSQHDTLNQSPSELSNASSDEADVSPTDNLQSADNEHTDPEKTSSNADNTEENSAESHMTIETALDKTTSQNSSDDSSTIKENSDDIDTNTNTNTKINTEPSYTDNLTEHKSAQYDDKSANEHYEENDKEKEADEDDELTEEEKQKKEKEEKLESYKQFVAEQKSKVEVDYQGIRVDIEANALPSRMYFIMNALSAIIASYGLVINSAAVVIGAMLVAMMLGPISGVALAIIDYRIPFLRKSLMTVLAGGAMVVIIGFIVGLLHQDTPLSSEILSRTQPTSMDLMIALAGGTAGAYAMISPHLSVAVVGVAVATALVPPLAASGILFAHGEGTLGLGALILAVTNIIAIQFTNALVLWFTGFRRLVKDDYKVNTYYAFLRRNAVPLILLTVIGGYLTYNFNTITKRQQFETAVKDSIGDYFIEQGNALTATQFLNRDDHQTVRAVIRGETRPRASDVKRIEAIINQRIDESYPKYLPVKIQLRYMPVVVIESSPSDIDSLDKTDVAILSNE